MVDLLNKFSMKDCNPVKSSVVTNQKFSKVDGEENVDHHVYRSLIGSLFYLTNTPTRYYASYKPIVKIYAKSKQDPLWGCQKSVEILEGDNWLWHLVLC